MRRLLQRDKRVFNKLSQQLNPNAKLGDVLQEFITQEITEGIPVTIASHAEINHNLLVTIPDPPPELFTQEVHALEDHTGIPGVGGEGYKGTVDNGNELLTVADNTFQQSLNYPIFQSNNATKRIATYPIAGQGDIVYKVNFWPRAITGIYRLGFQSGSASVPDGNWIAYVDLDVTAGMTGQEQELTIPANLLVGTNYWLVWTSPDGLSDRDSNTETSTPGTHKVWWNSAWIAASGCPIYRLKSGEEFTTEDGDVYFSRIDDKFYAYDSMNDRWDIVNPDETPHTGLLNETAHDLLDHTGLTGIPVDTNYKGSIDESASLPSDVAIDVLNNGLGASNASEAGPIYFDVNGYVAVPIILAGSTEELSLSVKRGAWCGAGNKARVRIYSDVAGVLGVPLFAEDVITLTNTTAFAIDGPFILTHHLEAGTYWLVFRVTDTSSATLATFNSSGEKYAVSANSGGSWIYTNDKSATVTLTATLASGYGDGDIVFAKDDNKFYRYNEGTNDWTELNPDEIPSFVSDSAGLTGASINGSSSLDTTVAGFGGEVLITRLAISATDGGDPPVIDYNIEVYEDAARTILAYKADNITDPTYEDRIPWEWFGDDIMYLKVINNLAAAITFFGTTLNYRQ